MTLEVKAAAGVFPEQTCHLRMEVEDVPPDRRLLRGFPIENTQAGLVLTSVPGREVPVADATRDGQAIQLPGGGVQCFLDKAALTLRNPSVSLQPFPLHVLDD